MPIYIFSADLFLFQNCCNVILFPCEYVYFYISFSDSISSFRVLGFIFIQLVFYFTSVHGRTLIYATKHGRNFYFINKFKLISNNVQFLLKLYHTMAQNTLLNMQYSTIWKSFIGSNNYVTTQSQHFYLGENSF